MIIQCPSCSTKFSIDSGQLQDFDSPRFHCSRCDHFFEMSLHPNANELEQQEPNCIPENSGITSGSSPAPSAPEIPEQPRFISTAESSAQSIPPTASSAVSMLKQPGPRQLDLIPNSDSSKSSSASPEALGEMSSRRNTFDTLSNIAVDWPDSLCDRVMEADLRGVTRASLPQAEYQAITEQAVANSGSAPLSWPSTGPISAPASEGPLHEPSGTSISTSPFHEQSLETIIESRSVFARPDLAPQTLNNSPTPSTTLTEELADNKPLRSPSTNQSVKFSKANFPDPTDARSAPSEGIFFGVKAAPLIITEARSVLLALSVPILACLWLWWFSANIDSSGGRLVDVALNTATSDTRMAPSGLELVDLRSEVLTLEDGNHIVQIAGNIFNGSTSTLRNVEIEALTFDSGNRELDRIVAKSNNGLVTANKLNNLREDALQALQDKTGIIGHELKPNEHFPFKLILTTDVNETAFFSARVYGVEPSSKVDAKSQT